MDAELKKAAGEEVHWWIMTYCEKHGVNYTEGFKAFQKQNRADRVAERAKAERAYDDRQVFIRNYQSETGATRAQAERHVDHHMPNLRRYGVNIQDVSGYISNPGGSDSATTLELFRTFFSMQSHREQAKRCAGEWISSIVERIMNKRAPAGDFKSRFILRYTQEVLSRNPDIAQAYETGTMSDSAIQTIFHFRFNLPDYDVWANH